MGKKKKKNSGDFATNRRARFDYQLLDRFECGIQLQGSEVKSLREGGANFSDAWVHVEEGEAWLESLFIQPYRFAGPYNNHEPVRPRKLLLHRKEIARLEAGSEQKGYTIVPVRIFPQGRWIKVEVALAQGKKKVDKRQDEKERIVQREMRRAMKGARE